MQKTKAALMVLSSQSGDTGTAEQRGQMIDQFLDGLQQHLTASLIETMLPRDLRMLMVAWSQKLNDTDSMYEANAMLAARIWASTADRNMVEVVPANNVTSIFNSMTRH